MTLTLAPNEALPLVIQEFQVFGHFGCEILSLRLVGQFSRAQLVLEEMSLLLDVDKTSFLCMTFFDMNGCTKMNYVVPLSTILMSPLHTDVLRG